MIRLKTFAMAAISLVLLATSAMAASNKDSADCAQTADPDLQLAACARWLKADHLSVQQQATAHNNRCVAFQEQRDFDHAIAECDEAIRLNPKNSVAYSNRCAALIKNQEIDRSFADCDEAIRLDPKNANFYAQRGTAWDIKGEVDRAIADYDAAIRLNPKKAMAYANRGGSWGQKGDFVRALSDLDQAIRIDPRNPAVHRTRAVTFRDMGDLDGALAEIDEAIALQPDEHLKEYARRGQIWRLKGDLDRALADQDKAIRLYDPARASVVGSAGLFVARGDTFRYRGEFARALADYDEALKQVPDAILALTGRGLTYERMDDLAHARADFESALASKSPFRNFGNRSALETAAAHLAALDSGAPLPVIPAVPLKATSATSLPTQQAVVPAAVSLPGVHQRRAALVIGNSAYQNVPALSNPQHDAEAMAKTLRAIGFDTVTLVTNATHQTLIDALRTFAGAAEQSDWAMVYYAGHGMEVNGVNYLIPTDARLAVDRDVQFEAVPLDQIMAALEGAKKIKLVLLDACRDNPFTLQMRHTPAPVAEVSAPTAGGVITTRSIGRGLGEVKVSGATLVVYAAKQGQLALDGEGDNSPFAVAVTQRIATPGVEINKVFRLVRDDVMEATAGRQEPYTYGSLPGSEDFFFVSKN
jgi:tetratricopeptide (TPR) repeat protein